MRLNIDINRLQIALHGVSAPLIEQALQGLDVELRRRLGVHAVGQGLSGRTAAVDLSELALDPVHLDATLDVAGLRGLIADRLLDAIDSRLQEPADLSAVGEP